MSKRIGKKFHSVKNLRFVENEMLINIDGTEHRFRLEKISKPLLKAKQIERETFQIDRDGYGIHWRYIDEDLSIDGLLGIRHFPSWAKSKPKRRAVA
ncbi:MAG TPA: DUF2442 domain-containing protein [Bacteroidota bacterium]|nr:DUF2442 domain-containing protein [Bacteroidota bacterium]